MFADYRLARTKVTVAFGNKTYEDVWGLPILLSLVSTVLLDDAAYMQHFNSTTGKK